MPGDARLSSASEIAFVRNLQKLVASYEEIAVMRIEHLRKSVLQMRSFEEGLLEIFEYVQASQRRHVGRLLKERSSSVGTPARQAIVLLSSNSRLSGKVSQHVATSFVDYLRAEASNESFDVIVVGAVGKEKLESLYPGRSFTYIPVSGNSTSVEQILPLIETLLQYESITLFYGHYKNLLTQEPRHITLGGADALRVKADSSVNTDNVRNFLYEPSLDDVVTFFEEEVFAILVRQAWSETWLSLLGSRITAMEQSSISISSYLSELEWKNRQEKRRINNQKQQDRLAGISLWGR